MTIYLYIKTHNQTGMKYLGKTSQSDPFSYPGSGTYWKAHLKKHGNDVSTQILLQSDDIHEISVTGLFFSKLWDIVSSDEWANLCAEDGYGHAHMLGGGIQSATMMRRITEGTSPHYIRSAAKKRAA